MRQDAVTNSHADGAKTLLGAQPHLSVSSCSGLDSEMVGDQIGCLAMRHEGRKQLWLVLVEKCEGTYRYERSEKTESNEREKA